MTPGDLAVRFEARADEHNAEANRLLINGHYASAAEQNIVARTLRDCASDVRELGKSPCWEGGVQPYLGRKEDAAAELMKKQIDEGEWAQWCERVRTVLYDELTARGGDGLGVAVSVCRALKAAGRPR